jgi:hypothetical protein
MAKTYISVFIFYVEVCAALARVHSSLICEKRHRLEIVSCQKRHILARFGYRVPHHGPHTPDHYLTIRSSQPAIG